MSELSHVVWFEIHPALPGWRVGVYGGRLWREFTGLGLQSLWGQKVDKEWGVGLSLAGAAPTRGEGRFPETGGLVPSFLRVGPKLRWSPLPAPTGPSRQRWSHPHA